MTRNARISGTGSYAPENIYKNAYFDDLLQQDVSEWLEQNVQIFERRWCDPDQSTADLCMQAAHKALESAQLSAEQLDLIIIATDTPEYISPSTASKVQYQLGAVNAGTFDMNTACAGFVTALDTATKYIKSDDQYSHILVIGAYTMSKLLNMQDKKTVTLFADGAGAVILSATDDLKDGFQASELRTQGQYCDWMGIYGGASHKPISDEVLEHKDHLLKFVKKFPPELNPTTWSDMALKLASRLNVDIASVDQFLITQININSIFETMDILEVPRERAHTIMHNFGYTGSACIPMALDDAVSKGKIKRGDLLFFIGSGGGLAFASAAFKF